jgi:hypothetical protein
MAERDDDFSFLLASIRRLLGELRTDLSPRVGRHERGAVLAEHVVETLNALEAKVDAEEQRYPRRVSPASKAAGSRELRFYSRLVWATHDALGWLQSDAHDLDLGALYFADEAALALISEGVEVVPVEASDYMYSTSSWPFSWVFEDHLKEPMPKSDRPIVLAFPAHERHTMLLHCLFVHELGHASVDAHQLVDQVFNAIKTSAAYRDALNQTIARAGGVDAATVVANAERVAKAWLEELLCDALAFGYLGPAYLFAFAQMGLSVSWSEPGEEHPSTTFRTATLVKLAEHQGWATYLEDRISAIWDWLAFAAKEPSTPGDILAVFAEEACEEAQATIFALSEQVLAGDRFGLDQWEGQDDHFATLLANDVLPAERADGVPADHPEILLAAWLQAIDKHEKTPEAINASVAEHRYHRFVAKALEMSTLLRTWEEVERDAAEA